MDSILATNKGSGRDLPAADHILNLTTEMSWIEVGTQSLPMSRNDGLGLTNYICCPTAAYIDYAIDELRHFRAHPLLKSALKALINVTRPLLRLSRLDRQVQPNNHLVATNLFDDVSEKALSDVTQGLTKTWPGHVIVWRSVNDASNITLKHRLESLGYKALASRQIYLFDARTQPPKAGRDEKRDAALLVRPDYQVVQQARWGDEAYARMAWLYQRLYLDKYTWLNPVYGFEFIKAAHLGGWLDLMTLMTPENRIDGVIGLIQKGDTMAAPVVGYDTDLPEDLGLYRRLMALAMAQAREQGLLYNMSAGAARFKRHRGGVAALEYSLVYDRHLPWPHRLAGKLVRAIVNEIGIPVLKRFEL